MTYSYTLSLHQSKVNIRRDVTDKFYRYKMPKLQSRIEGRGNGIKSVIVNMSDIAKSLARPPSYPTKFFGFELGSQSIIDMKNEKFVVNGSHNVERLASVLDSFISKFVLCPACFNPETVTHSFMLFRNQLFTSHYHTLNRLLISSFELKYTQFH